jgi:hypothetical protein
MATTGLPIGIASCKACGPHFTMYFSRMTLGCLDYF